MCFNEFLMGFLLKINEKHLKLMKIFIRIDIVTSAGAEVPFKPSGSEAGLRSRGRSQNPGLEISHRVTHLLSLSLSTTTFYSESMPEPILASEVSF